MGLACGNKARVLYFEARGRRARQLLGHFRTFILWCQLVFQVRAVEDFVFVTCRKGDDMCCQRVNKNARIWLQQCHLCSKCQVRSSASPCVGRQLRNAPVHVGTAKTASFAETSLDLACVTTLRRATATVRAGSREEGRLLVIHGTVPLLPSNCMLFTKDDGRLLFESMRTTPSSR